MEIWKPIKNYENLYEISSKGRIKSLPKKGSNKTLLLKNRYTDPSTGYISIMLHKNNKSLTLRIHRLLAIHFVENPNNYPIVNHIDGDKKNNNINNLEWTTYSLNTLHSYKLGLQKIKFGDDNHASRLLDKEIEEIQNLFLKGHTNKCIASLYKIGATQISRIRSKQRRIITDNVDYSINKVGHKGRVINKKDALKIIDLLSKGIEQKKIAIRFNTDTARICTINSGKTFSNLPRPTNLPMKYKRIGKQKVAILNDDIC